jgi:hypothetical protein
MGTNASPVGADVTLQAAPPPGQWRRVAALVYRRVLAPTVAAGAARMQALVGEPGDGVGSPDGSPHRDDRASEEADEA